MYLVIKIHSILDFDCILLVNSLTYGFSYKHKLIYRYNSRE